MYQSVKRARTVYTDEKIENLRKNIAQFDWAKEKAEKIIADAEQYMAYGVERIGTMFPPQEIPRSHFVNVNGCPNCGKEMLRYHGAGWNMDFVNHPWKSICPHCGNIYPSNDFGTFYESGLDEHGVFSYDRADRSLLVNELYPEKGPDYAVDDGRGWVSDPADPEHTRYAFIPTYAAWMVWGPRHSNGHYYGSHAVWALAEAYLITGDRKYGFAAAMLFYRMALLYPTLDTSKFPWEAGYYYSDGRRNRGRILGSIYDTVFMREVVDWYDMLFDCIDDEFAAYLREKPIRYMGDAPESGAAIRNAIEEQCLLQIYPDVRNYILDCNPGPHHSLLLKTAKILDRDDLFEEYTDYLFRYIDHVSTGMMRYDLETLILSEVNRDGFAGEVSPGYNGVWFYGFSEAAEFLLGHKDDLFRHPKFRKLGDMVINYAAAEKYTMNIADCERCGNPGILLEKDSQILFFLVTGNPRYAQLLVSVFGDGPICTDWYRDCAAVDAKIRDAAEKAGPFRGKSRCLPGYGLEVVESHPADKDPESNAIFFGKNFGHGQRDTLNLYLHGFGIDIMPDHGYASFANANMERFRWTSNYISHNTVAMRQKEAFTNAWCGENIQKDSLGGKIRHYHTDGFVSAADIDALDMFDRERVVFIRDVYRRTVITVDLDGKSRYLVDLFAVGAAESHLSYHAAGTETTAQGAVFIPQNGGTYAGEEVLYADPDYDRTWCDGFDYLTDVRRASLNGTLTVDWKCFDNWHVWEKERDVHLRIHLLAGADEAALCTGIPPQARIGNPRALTYLVAKNDGPTDYVSVLEPYEDVSFIETCTHKTCGNTVTVTVTHTNGRVDTICVTRDGTALRVAVESTTGYRMAYGDTVLTGMVDAFTKELTSENCVTVRLDSDVSAEALVGKFIDIDTDVEPNAFYEIKGAELLANGLWKLDVGDCSFITGYIDRDHKELGMTYSIGEGASVRITM